MKWQNVQRNLQRDPWLADVLFHDEIVREGKMPDEQLQRAIVDCNVTHVMFRGSTDSLRIDSRPVYRGFEISSAPRTAIENEPEYDDFKDGLAYQIGYYLVMQVHDPSQIHVTHLSHSPYQLGVEPNVRSIRWAAVREQQKLKGFWRRWVAVVRNVSIVSEGEYLKNGYDVFRFPERFSPFDAGWHLKQKNVISPHVT